MTRKETLEHAREIVSRIFHGHKDEVTIKGWVARDKGGVPAFYTTTPRKTDWGWGWLGLFYLMKDEFPSVKWEDDEPTEAELTIKLHRK